MIRYRIYAIGVVLLGTITGLLLNIVPRTDTFQVCPNTEYCNSEYFSDPNSAKSIEYNGFPYRVKMGNPDWCSHGTDGICEAGKYHPVFEWQYYLYNMIIVVAPSILLLLSYLTWKRPHVAKRVLIGMVLVICNLWLGWLIADYLQNHTVRGVGLDDPTISQGNVVAGVPLASNLSPASSCVLEADTREERASCAARSINYGDIWDKPVSIYLNWLFWSAACSLGSLLLLRLSKKFKS